MTIISVTIALLLFGLLATALYKGIFHKNKINNPYTSQFEDITAGTKPTMDGHNPIEQTKEKVEQKTTFEEQQSDRMQDGKNIKLSQAAVIVAEKADPVETINKEEDDFEDVEHELPKASFDKETTKPPEHHYEDEDLEEEWNETPPSPPKMKE